MISRRLLLGALLSGAALPGFAWAEAPATSPRPKPRGQGADPAPVGTSAERLIEAAKLGGVVSYVVVDRLTGAVLEGHDADRSLPPASVAKSVTALYALDRLYTFPSGGIA